MSDDERGRREDESVRADGSPAIPQPLSADGGHINTDRQHQLTRVFQALSSQRRRYVLYGIRDSGACDLDTLATFVESIERDDHSRERSSDDDDRVKTQLVHGDIPYLADAGLVEYDRRSEAVRYADPIGYLDSVIHLCEVIDAPSDRAE